ncbi:MAG: hypothetical protein C0616_06485 [Desulfuromonas sp.]|nr:MAG: hypothetical protein C0616_06485 [Desulfuromonas sp.]
MRVEGEFITSQEELFRIARCGVVLTANNRLARSLRDLFDQTEVKRGSAAWITPAILPLSVWYLREYDRLVGAEKILSETQSLFLWEQVVRLDMERSDNTLLQVASTAGRAREASQLLHQFRAGSDFVSETEEQKAWLRWNRDYRQKITENGWIDSSAVPGQLVQSLATGGLIPPDEVVLAGFDRLTPEMVHLVDQLRVCRTKVFFWNPERVAETVPVKFGALDPVDEVKTCARWARRILEKNRTVSVAVVMPQLHEYRDLLELTFQAEFDPAGAVSGVETEDAFSLSLGRPLAAEGVVAVAMLVLGLKPIENIDTLSRFFRSVYLAGSAEQWGWRADVDRQLRAKRQRERSLKALGGTLTALKMPDELRRHLKGQLDAINRLLRIRKTVSCGRWVESFTNLLDALGWPGWRSLTSREYQAVQKFKQLLGDFSSLDRLGIEMSREEAVSQLQREASRVLFQPEARDGNLQLLGILEAGGLSFDYLWVMGAHENALPQVSHPNPFLPISLQRQTGMPHVDADGELEWAEGMVHRLKGAAGEVVFSWAQQVEGVIQRSSRLVVDCADATLDLSPVCDPLTTIWDQKPPLEFVADHQAPPLPANRKVSGGTRLLQDQALCPFRAMAHHRLRCAGLEEPDVGLDNMTRGNLVHRLLEKLWERLESRDGLLQLDEARLRCLIEEEVVTVGETIPGASPLQRDLEQGRLVHLMLRWMEHEKERPPFKVEVELLEKEKIIALGPLQIKTKVDRIDRLADGNFAIVDYKTGRTSVKDWMGERIREPQLPIYCTMVQGEDVGAVVYASVRSNPKEMGYNGLVRNTECWDSSLQRSQARFLAEAGLESFDALKDAWGVNLERLARAFVAGEAQVDPLDAEKTCRYCDLVPLCRISERRLSSLDEEGGG